MKKLFIFILSVLLITGCSSTDDKKEAVKENEVSINETKEKEDIEKTQDNTQTVIEEKSKKDSASSDFQIDTSNETKNNKS